MNLLIKYSFLFLLCLIMSSHISACRKKYEKKNEQSAPDFKELRSIAEKNHVVGMTVLGYKDGDVRFQYNYGYSDIDRKVKVNDNTIFAMASVSKIITGMAIMKLVDEGSIKSTENDISVYLGYSVRNPKYPNIPIKIRHLMTHTSGITDSGVSYKFIEQSKSPNPPSMMELFSKRGIYYNPGIWLDAGPGEKFEYSNFGTILAGAIVGKVSGKRFDEYVNDKILDPLGMRGGFTTQDIENINRLAVVYTLDENRDPQASAFDYKGKKPAAIDLSDYIPGSNPTQLGPHGRLRTRAKDLAKIMEAFISGGIYKSGVYNSKDINIRVMKESTVRLMLKTHWKGYGFYGLYRQKGLFIHITDDLIPGIRLYGHIGDAMGLLSAVYFSPRKKFGIIFVMNGGDHKAGKSGFYEIEEQVFREAFGLLFY